VSEFLLDQKEVKLKSMPTVDDSKLTERRMEFVNAEEDSLRDATWEILREAFEDFANDVRSNRVRLLELADVHFREMFKHALCWRPLHHKNYV
jgi:hypothetical protein